MIPRYTRKEMSDIWEAENRFKIWLEIETLACEKMADLGIIPESCPKALREKGKHVWYMNALNEGHGYRKKDNRDLYQQAVVMFFQQYLL